MTAASFIDAWEPAPSDPGPFRFCPGAILEVGAGRSCLQLDCGNGSSRMACCDPSPLAFPPIPPVSVDL